jgi:hypothetical protein
MLISRKVAIAKDIIRARTTVCGGCCFIINL